MTTRPVAKVMNDLLGEEGRKAADACVKVAIFGIRKLRRYTRDSALERLWKCYGGELPNKDCGMDLDPVILPERDGKHRLKKSYDIRDISKALHDFDRMKFVKRDTDEIGNENETASKHYREVVEEFQNSSDAIYSPEVAQRRVRDCYAGNFPGDVSTLPSKEEDSEDHKPYSIFDIHDALARSDKVINALQCPEEEHTQAGSYTSALRKSIDQQRETLSEEYKKAVRECQGKEYSAKQANRKVKDCYKDCKKNKADKNVLKRELKLATKTRKKYTIFDIRDICVRCEDSFSVDTTRKHSDARKKVESEYQETISSCKRQGYSRDRAERLVRNCYVGSFPKDKAILPEKKRYLISDIKEAVDYYDRKPLVDKYPAEREMQPDERKRKIKEIDEYRAAIKEEHDKGEEEQEIDHGSGFIIQSQFIMTCGHVVSDGKESVYIYNKIINPKLKCEVIHHVEANYMDLAILYCKELNISAYEIQPLQLSDETLLQGMSIFSFGYPFFHLGERALLATGFVSGTAEPYGQGEIPPLMLLNCPLNNGNSGGPLLRLVNKKEVKVVGVISQKHIKEILEHEELKIIENIEESLQTSSITDFQDKMKGAEQVRKNGAKPDPCQTPLNLLTLKLHRALHTHCQFVSSKAVPTKTLLKQFLPQAAAECGKEHRTLIENIMHLSETICTKNLYPKA